MDAASASHNVVHQSTTWRQISKFAQHVIETSVMTMNTVAQSLDTKVTIKSLKSINLYYPKTVQQEQPSSMLLWFGVNELEAEFVHSFPTFRTHFLVLAWQYALRP